MSRLGAALVASLLFASAPASAACAPADKSDLSDGLTNPNNTVLRAGQQILAVHGTDGMACTIYFVLKERSEVMIEMAPLPLPKDNVEYPNVPFDVANVSAPAGSDEKLVTLPLGRSDPTDQGLISDFMLDAGSYALTFPSRIEKIGPRFVNVDISIPTSVRMTIGSVRPEYPSEPVPHTANVGDSFDVNYQSQGVADPLILTQDRGKFVSLSISSDRPFGDSGIGNMLRLGLSSGTDEQRSVRSVLPNNVRHLSGGDEIRFSFFLPPGKVVVQPFVELPFLVRVAPRELWTAKLTGRFEEVSDVARPEAVQAIERMLKTSGYDKFLEPIDVASMPDIKADPTHHEISARDFDDFRGMASSRTDEGEREYAQSDADAPVFRVPEYVILMALKQDGYEFQDTQFQIAEAQGQTLFDMILTQASVALGVSRSKIGIVVPGRCVNGLVRGDDMIDTVLRGSCVGAASQAKEIPIGGFKGFGAAGNHNLGKMRSDFTASVETYLNRKFGAANIQYLSRDSDYVEAIIRGLRGYVIKGSPYWEKVSVYFVQQRDERTGRAKLRLIADGSLAAGLGKYPPDTQFDTNIENKNSAALDQFIRSTLDDFIRAMVK